MDVPYINWMKSISVYETGSHLYLVGSDLNETRFRVLKIDRSPVPVEDDSSFLDCLGSSPCTATVEAESPFDRLWRLNIIEDPFIYTKSDMARLLHTIQAANRRNFQPGSGHSSSSDLKQLKSNSVTRPQASNWFRLGGVFKRRQPKSSSPGSSNMNEQSSGNSSPQSPHELQQAAASALHTGTCEPSLILTTKCEGLVGVVRFLRGYYLIVITKSRLIAQIGEHKIFKVEDTTTIYIPGTDQCEVFPNSTTVTTSRTRSASLSKSTPDDTSGVLVPPSPFLDSSSEWTQFCATTLNRTRILAEEARYLKLFNSVDLGSNFYYSYTYDLSHTLQYNMQALSEIQTAAGKNIVSTSTSTPDDRFVWNWRLIPPRFRPGGAHRGRDKATDADVIPARNQPHWFIPLFHGTISQAAISACGMPLMITLIGRRSRYFAGTRFLKRGTSLLGNVANEVETEQIVHDTSYACLRRARCSSYVQLRGSVPLFWSQEPSKLVVGRPPLELSREDPYYEAFGAHFSNLFERFGCPVIVFNLMKRREKRRFELALSEGYERGLAYLSQFLPSQIPLPEIRTFPLGGEQSLEGNPPLIYIGFDIARVQKHKRLVALDQLHPIVDACIRRTGIYISCPGRRSLLHGSATASAQHQCGLIRVNCVDCLDRTNTAQFVIGRAALAYQLYHLGFLTEPVIAADSRIDRLLQNLYDEHGDTLALQYGGSQLVHNIDTYRKTHRLSSQSRDFLQTLSRYYSNKFSDWDKQCATNLFLRIYRPLCWSGTLFQLVCEYLYAATSKGVAQSSVTQKPLDSVQSSSSNNSIDGCCNPDAVIAMTAAALMGPLWDQTSDNYLHWLDAWSRLPVGRTPLTDWCPRALMQSLPWGLAYAPNNQGRRSNSLFQLDVNDPRVDWYAERYQPNNYQTLDKPASMPHLRWVELLVQPPPVDSPSLTTRSQRTSVNPIDEYTALARPKHHSVVSTISGQITLRESPSEVGWSNYSEFSNDNSRSSSPLTSMHSVPNFHQLNPSDRQPSSSKLPKAFNTTVLTATVEEGGNKVSDTSSLRNFTFKDWKKQKQKKLKKGTASKNSATEKAGDPLDDSSSDSDYSTGSADSFLKIYPPTLSIHYSSPDSPRGSHDSFLGYGRTRDTEQRGPRLLVQSTKRRVLFTTPHVDQKSRFICSNQGQSESRKPITTQWSKSHSVFDPNAVILKTSAEVRSSYQCYLNSKCYTPVSETYRATIRLRLPSAKDIALYKKHVQLASGQDCVIPSSSMATYSATAHVARALHC